MKHINNFKQFNENIIGDIARLNPNRKQNDDKFSKLIDDVIEDFNNNGKDLRKVHIIDDSEDNEISFSKIEVGKSYSFRYVFGKYHPVKRNLFSGNKENWDRRIKVVKIPFSLTLRKDSLEKFFRTKRLNLGYSRVEDEVAKKEALEQTEKLIIEKLKANINNSGSHTNEILKHLKKQKFNPIGAYLKINSWDDFSILLILPENEFLSDKIYSVYNYLTELEDKVSSEFYKLNVSICDTDGEVDDNCIKADGYAIHKPRKEEYKVSADMANYLFNFFVKEYDKQYPDLKGIRNKNSMEISDIQKGVSPAVKFITVKSKDGKDLTYHLRKNEDEKEVRQRLSNMTEAEYEKYWKQRREEIYADSNKKSKQQEEQIKSKFDEVVNGLNIEIEKDWKRVMVLGDYEVRIELATKQKDVDINKLPIPKEFDGYNLKHKDARDSYDGKMKWITILYEKE